MRQLSTKQGTDLCCLHDYRECQSKKGHDRINNERQKYTKRHQGERQCKTNSVLLGNVAYPDGSEQSHGHTVQDSQPLQACKDKLGTVGQDQMRKMDEFLQRSQREHRGAGWRRTKYPEG